MLNFSINTLIFLPVPMGTVLFVHMILKSLRFSAIVLATDSTYCISAEPSLLCGVPTAIKIISESLIDFDILMKNSIILYSYSFLLDYLNLVHKLEF